MPRSSTNYEARLARLLDALKNPTVAHLLWAEEDSGSGEIRRPVYQIHPSSKSILSDAHALTKLAGADSKLRLRMPPAIRYGATRVTISVREKTTSRENTVGQVRLKLLKDLAAKVNLPENPTSSELDEHLRFLTPQVARETPYVRSRIEALKKLVHRHPNERLKLLYPQRDYRAYISGVPGGQVNLRLTGLLLVCEVEQPIEVSPPGSRKRATRSDHLGRSPSFRVGRTLFFFQRD